MPVVETDLYLAEGEGMPTYHSAELKRVLDSRVDRGRPVIAERIFIRRLLANLELAPDYVVHVSRPECEGSFVWFEAFVMPQKTSVLDISYMA